MATGINKGTSFQNMGENAKRFHARARGGGEGRTAAIYHVDATILSLIDKQFDRFLSQLGLSRTDVLTKYFLAPLNARRDMAMLDVIHRAVLRKGPKQVIEFFKLYPNPSHPTGRSSLRRHDCQLMSFRKGKLLETTAKSILGLVDIYKMLPQSMVDAETVHDFQRKLQGMLEAHATSNMRDWETLFSPRHVLHQHPHAKILHKVVTASGNCRL